MSPFCYNEASVMDQYPLPKEEAMTRGLQWYDIEVGINLPDHAVTVAAKNLPPLIRDVDNDMATKIIVCEESGRPYRIIKQEIDFYRQHTIPLPRKHPDLRHQERLEKRPGNILYLRTCDKT